MNTLKLRSTEAPTGKMPIMMVDIIGEDGSTLHRGYLSPFRQYCFQVSGTFSGSGDFGSSEVIGLKHCKIDHLGSGTGFQSNCDSEEITKELLFGQALIAITRYANRYNALTGSVASRSGDGRKLQWFIDEVYRYLFN